MDFLNSHGWFIAVAIGLALLMVGILFLAELDCGGNADSTATQENWPQGKMYFVRGLPDRQIALLREYDYCFSTVNLAELRPPPVGESTVARLPQEDGILIGSRDFNRVLRCISAASAGEVDLGLSCKHGNVFEVVVYDLYPVEKTEGLTISCDDGSTELRAFYPMTRHLLAAPLGAAVQLKLRGDVSPAGMVSVFLKTSTSTHVPSGLGHAIKDESGNLLAELVGFNLFIFADLLATADWNESVLVYTCLLKRLQPLLTPRKVLEAVVEEELLRRGPASVQAHMEASGMPAPTCATTLAGVATTCSESKQEALRYLTDRLLVPLLGRGVRLSYAADHLVSDGVDNSASSFDIVLSGLAQTPVLDCAPERLFGLPTTNRYPADLPAGAGIPLFDDDGFIIAELRSGALFVLFDLISRCTLCEMRSYARMLTAFGGLHRRQQEANNVLPPASQDDFVKACLSVVVPATADVRLFGEFHTDLCRAVAEEQELMLLKTFGDETLGREFDNLHNIASVTGVAVTERSLEVLTKVLYCRHPETGILHEIGAFKIVIPTDGGDIRWFNQTRKVDGYKAFMQAPHVFPDGTACLGNVKNLFPRLIVLRDFASAVQVAIAFIESVNIEDVAGRWLVNWPAVPGSDKNT